MIMAVKEIKGKVAFDKEDAKWGFVKGEAKWCKVLKPDDYGNFGVSLYVDKEEMAKYLEVVEAVADTAFDGATELGKKANKQDEFTKHDKEGKEFISFKLEGVNSYSGEPNKITIIDKYGNEVKDWDKLIGNGSIVKVKYRAKPYFMSSSKIAGASVRFFALQVINLEEYSGGGGNGFSNEASDSDEPF